MKILAIVLSSVAAMYWRFSGTMENTLFFVFQTRDLARAAEFARGQPVFFGPEVTGGGNLFGGFYYGLLALPLRFGTGWEGAWWLMVLLACAAAGLLLWVLHRIAGLEAGVAAFFFLLVSAPLDRVLRIFVNPSYLPFFACAAVAGLLLAFANDSPRTRQLGWVGFGFALGLSVQLHFSAIALLPAALFVQAAAPRMGLSRLPRGTFVTGLGTFALALLPFFAWSLLSKLGIRIGQPEPTGSGAIGRALPALFDLVSFSPGSIPPFSEMATKLLVLLPFPMLIAIALAAQRLIGLRATSGEQRGAKALQVLAVLGAFSFVPAAYWFFRPIGGRYAVAFAVCAAGLAALTHLRALANRRSALAYVVLCTAAAVILALNAGIPTGFFVVAACAMVAGFVAAVKERPLRAIALGAAVAAASLQNPVLGVGSAIPNLQAPSIGELQYAADVIRGQTGWGFEEARQRLFFVADHMELSIEDIYRSPGRRLAGDLAHRRLPEAPDGYFLTVAFPSLPKRPSPQELAGWIQTQPIQEDLRQGLRDGTLRIGAVQRRRRMTLAPFWIGNGTALPRKIQNVGYPYQVSAESRLLEGAIGESGVRRLSPDEALFFWNDCAHPACATGAVVRFRKDERRLSLAVSIVGGGLEQPSEWTGPGWVQSWKKPFLKVTCGTTQQTVPLLESVGINRAHSATVSGMHVIYNSILAPVEMTRELPCEGPLRALVAGRESSTIYEMSGPREMTPKEVEYRP